MCSIKTSYMGIEFSSPIIASSSPFTASADSIKELAASGAGAVVLKSIFEEQILGQAATMMQYSDSPEANEYLQRYMEGDYLNDYLNLIKRVKSETSLPVIASINCHSLDSWTDYAGNIEQVGADALELNIFLQPTSAVTTAAEIEDGYMDIAASVVEAVTRIPVSVKLAPHFTNTLNVIAGLRNRGIKGVTLFNRMFEPEIDTQELKLVAGQALSSQTELRTSLRTTALCSDQIEGMDISVSTGVHDADDAIRCLLAGASTVQVCTALYKHGIGYLRDMNENIENWMRNHGFDSIGDFRGKMNSATAKDKQMYYRTQYMRYFPG